LAVNGKCPDPLIIDPCKCIDDADNPNKPTLFCGGLGIDNLRVNNKEKMRSSLTGGKDIFLLVRTLL
jgi:hypothetical protein